MKIPVRKNTHKNHQDKQINKIIQANQILGKNFKSIRMFYPLESLFRIGQRNLSSGLQNQLVLTVQ